MSVYRRPGAQTYSFDFRIKGHRFSGDTARNSKREAQAVERVARQAALAQIAEGIALDKPVTWELAASRYWLEIGQHHKNRETTLKSLAWLSERIGKQTLLAEIDDNRVAALVMRRRGELRQVGSGDSRATQRPVAPATVNRTMTEPLRKVLLRAEKVWKVRVGDIVWRTHLLAEPRERVREASQGEEAAIMAQLERGYDDAVRFAFLSGCRRMEVVGLTWDRIDFFGRRFTVLGKGDKLRTIPMSQAIFDLLWAQRGRHETVVFTFIALKTRPLLKQVRGRRYQISLRMLSDVIENAARKAGVINFHMHDTRHTLATRALRASNLKVVQQILGHEDIATTTKYAHAMDDDLRAALEAASETSIPSTKLSRVGGN
jgi:integrase